MTERPILFSGAMVRAILDGRKTQTRRICKPRFDDRTPCEHYSSIGSGGVVTDHMMRHCEHGSEGQPCPLGVAGDRLWVRETWRTCRSLDHLAPRDIAAGAPILYEADGWMDGYPRGFDKGKTRVSIHMPRWASRINLEITSVRAERLQDITEADAEAEGCDHCGVDGLGGVYVGFYDLWISIYGAESWNSNPYVWRIEFRRVL